MLKVKVKLKDKKEFTVPLPYALLQASGWVVSSPKLWNFVNNTFIQKNVEEKAKSFIPASIDRREVRNLLREIKRYRGLTIVEVKDKVGTEVMVRL